MNSAAFRKTLALLTTLAVLLVPLVAAGLYVADKHRWANARLAELEPRHARLLGLASRRDELRDTAAKVSQLLTQHTYAADLDVTQAGNDAQQRIRQVFSQAGLEISSSQVLPPKTEKQFDRIPLTVRTDGNLLALQSALTVLESQKPSILVDELNIQASGNSRNAAPEKGPRLSAQFRLAVLKMRP